MREVLWKHDKPHDFVADLRMLCRSLDSYEAMTFPVLQDPSQRHPGQRVHLIGDGYKLGGPQSDTGSVFSCPECGETEFHVLEGALDGKPVLGLACVACETYGILCPAGL